MLLAHPAGQSLPCAPPTLSQSFPALTGHITLSGELHPSYARVRWVCEHLASPPPRASPSETGLQLCITLRVKSSLPHLAQRTVHTLSLHIHLLNTPIHAVPSHNGQCTHCPYTTKTKNRDSYESRFFCKSVYLRF